MCVCVCVCVCGVCVCVCVCVCGVCVCVCKTGAMIMNDVLVDVITLPLYTVTACTNYLSFCSAGTSQACVQT